MNIYKVQSFARDLKNVTYHLKLDSFNNKLKFLLRNMSLNIFLAVRSKQLENRVQVSTGISVVVFRQNINNVKNVTNVKTICLLIMQYSNCLGMLKHIHTLNT